MKARKVYRLDGGHRYIRQALKMRGWVEKITPKTKRFEIGDRTANPDDDQIDPEDSGLGLSPGSNSGSNLPDDEFDVLVSRWLRDYEPNLQFVPHYRINFDQINRNTVLNHFPKTRFITKTGLTSCLHDLSWVSDRHSEDFYPRY